jgi:hypothetical protein
MIDDEIEQLEKHYNEICEFYSMSDDIVLPIINADIALNLHTFSFGCPICDKYVVKLKGKVIHSIHYTEINSIGICPKCQCFVRIPKYRFYKDNRVMAIAKTG